MSRLWVSDWAWTCCASVLYRARWTAHPSPARCGPVVFLQPQPVCFSPLSDGSGFRGQASLRIDGRPQPAWRFEQSFIDAEHLVSVALGPRTASEGLPQHMPSTAADRSLVLCRTPQAVSRKRLQATGTVNQLQQARRPRCRLRRSASRSSLSMRPHAGTRHPPSSTPHGSPLAPRRTSSGANRYIIFTQSIIHHRLFIHPSMVARHRGWSSEPRLTSDAGSIP